MQICMSFKFLNLLARFGPFMSEQSGPEGPIVMSWGTIYVDIALIETISMAEI